MKFNHRTAIITGAGGGIGRALCRLLHESGVAIAATDSTLELARQATREIADDGGVEAKAYTLDVTDSRSIAGAARMIYTDFGKIDILINNAGAWAHPGGTHRYVDTPEEYWEKIIDINLRGVFRVTHAFLPDMIKHQYGRIVNLGSIAGAVGLPGHADYAASKAGVIMMSKTLAMEVAKDNITVNCVSPGMVSNNDEEPVCTAGTWVGRTGRRTEIADLIRFLVSDDAAFITGVDYTIDGGRILGPKTVSDIFLR